MGASQPPMPPASQAPDSKSAARRRSPGSVSSAVSNEKADIPARTSRSR